MEKLINNLEVSINIRFIRNLKNNNDRIHHLKIVRVNYQLGLSEVISFYKPISKMISYK